MTPLQPRNPVSEHLASRHGALFVTLLALLGTYPFSDESRTARFVLDLWWILVLVSLLRALSSQPTIRRLVLILGLPAVLMGTLARSVGYAPLHPFALVLRIALLVVIIVGLFRNLLERRRVTMDAVLSACCIYLLLGVAWAGVYGLIHWANPGAFRFPGPSPGPDGHELLYFSLITMTTVGYGDIAPLSGVARMIAAIEGLLAQLYLAIVIARMVSIELAERSRNPST